MNRFLLLSIVGLSAACWVPAEKGRQMQDEIRALREQQSASQKSLDEQRARLDEQLTRADQKIAEVARSAEELSRAARSTDADFGVQIERVIKEVQELRGVLELSEYRLKKLEDSVDTPDTGLRARLDAIDKQLAEAKAAPPPKPAVAETPKGKKELLAYAQGLVKDAKVNDARGVYRDIVKQWPNESGVTDQAYYELGETYYEEKKYRSALQEYIKVVEKFAGGIYADDAYYKIGMSSLDIGNLEDAKIFFSEVVKNYKKSPLAKSAQEKLNDVQKRLDKEKKKK